MTTEQSRQQRALALIETLRHATRDMPRPMSSLIIQQFGRDPFLVLISCLLSLRTKDSTTYPASLRLFAHAKNPQELLALPVHQIEKLIYPVGFYRRKAQLMHTISADLIARYYGNVPSDEQELLSLKGVGRKTANLVRGEGFGIPALCVDTHVHRISNRLGLVATTTPEQTELALMQLLPPETWIEYNQLLVMWGQNICVPISPWCSRCPVYDLCQRVGVTRQR